MKRVLSALAAAAFVLGIATAGASASSKSKMTATPAPMTKKMTCPKGKTYVKGYTKKNGTKVAAYCR